MSVRTTKTKSGATAVQVVRYEQGRTIIMKHIGSSNDPTRISSLKETARDWIINFTRQQTLFAKEATFDPLFTRYRYLGTRHNFLYETLNEIFKLFGFDDLKSRLLLDLVLVRIVEPASKLRSQKLLSDLFGISYDLTSIYKSLKAIATLKEKVEGSLVKFARENLNFDFAFVLYDVTTLYFESFTGDELRQCGFSKDNKANQPQIVIGLLVQKDGFPLSFNIFPGNKFEGHTIIPVLTALKDKYLIPSLTVVADAAMLSENNIQAIKQAHFSYIVGARLGYLDLDTVIQINRQLDFTDGTTIRIPSTKGVNSGFLICDFSSKRYLKDKSDTEKQIAKAQKVVGGELTPKRYKFLNFQKTGSSLNQKLIERTKLLWGIKGYITDLSLPNQVVIDRYHDLWQVEKSFRMAKSDLLMRPVYHFRREAIEAHILICVMALAVARFMELKGGKSIRVLMESLKKITDARVFNPASGEEALWRVEIPEDIRVLLKDIGVTY
ncbi:IS1634 family transposase [Candidatus Daviesbacteria bacterium]|nr:IS1634 family transposase [Candidatus Daviesbacteria bacterium]